MLGKIKKNSGLILFFVLVVSLAIMIIDSIALPLQASIVCGTGRCLCVCNGTDCSCTLFDDGCACSCEVGGSDSCTFGKPPGPPTP
jgi:hypothetical protein